MMNGNENNNFRIFLRGLKGLKGGEEAPLSSPEGDTIPFLAVVGHTGCSLLFGQTTPPSSSVANEGFAPLCGAAATPVAALKTPVASRGEGS